MRLLHEAFLYFEIGSNQVANNDNNFCNKIKHETNPHEFNNFATSRTFFICISFHFPYFITHIHIQIRITQPTDFLPSNYINFYVRQLTSKAKQKQKCLRFQWIQKFHTHTQHTEWHVALPKLQQKTISKNTQNQSRPKANTLFFFKSQQIKTKRQTILIRTIFIYFISKQEWYTKDETGNK